MSFDKNDGLHNLFGEDSDAFKASDGPLNFHSNDANVTPNILLEQLAYVDNFMPDFENDMASFGAPAHGESHAGGLGLDDRLAAELSAFADETFIFPDEDKPENPNGSQDSRQGSSADALAPGLPPSAAASPSASSSQPAANRSSRFLSQRRNNFLASQHDNSRQRFSSRRPFDIANRSPSDDHGGFTNVDIADGPVQPFAQPGVPYSNSPLSNLVSDSNSQTAELFTNTSNTPLLTPQDHLRRQSQAPPSQNSYSEIHMPDYSSIPTRTLLALLPKVKVPSGAWDSLRAVGFDQDQIDAIAAIIAHHQMHKNSNPSISNSASQVVSQGVPPVTDENAASFLLQFLSHDNNQPQRQRQRQPQHPQPQHQQQQQQQQEHQQQQEQQEQKQHHHQPLPHDEDISNSRQTSMRNAETNATPRSIEHEKAADSFFNTFFNADSVRPDVQPSASESRPRLNSNSSRSDRSVPSDKEVLKSNYEKATSRKPSVDRRGMDFTSSLHSADEKRSGGPKPQHPKRKMKEQEMEGSIQELSELALGLQHRIHTLEMENRLLKNLVMERGELKGVEQAESVRRELMKKIKDDKKEENKMSGNYVEKSDF
ncbi:LAQU0S01e07844g1_1 [Lachancea quebecensis]|uniref:LAQU0S01e07844g1_1 n=1 Tax=Lachancea quebecensis TaxID=1654605 RepID=A0A0P1KM11_9SACH|nr:LAQU0S01e07844g1_1 [Lachancea quebecensis]